MREHKFRAWDKINHEMCEVRAIDWIENRILCSPIRPTRSAVSYRWRDIEEFEIEDFTGKQDKNGKDIYEGDKIRDGACESIVVWNDQYASFALRSNSWAFDHFFGEAVESKDCEVIGTIHEEPK